MFKIYRLHSYSKLEFHNDKLMLKTAIAVQIHNLTGEMSAQRFLLILLLSAIQSQLSFARPRPKAREVFKFSVDKSQIKSLTERELLEILGEGGLSPEYMKINSSNVYTHVDRNHGQACKSVEVDEDLSEDYFPRYVKNVVCVDTGNTCKPSDGSFSCFKTTIVKHVLKKEDRYVLQHEDESGKIEYYDRWRKHDIEIGVGCECSN